MKRIILVFLLMFATASFAKITAQLNENEVSPGETFQLILTEDELSAQGIPDLTPLQQDFDIIGTERRVSQVISNGQVDSVSQWIIHLRAKDTGKFQIPEIQVGKNKSNPLTINVVSISNRQQPEGTDIQQHSSQDPVILSTTINTDTPYVQQQVIYSVKIFSKERIINSEYQPPQVNHALMVDLGKLPAHQQVINGIPYLVEELRYAIFPQQSGSITIRPPVFQAIIYDGRPEQVNATDKPIELKVKGIPSSYQAKNWLPASQVSLSERYEEPKAVLKQGDTLTREITIKAEGAPAQLLPELDTGADSPDINSYPEKISQRNAIKGNLIYGIAKRKITYLLNKSGKITLPEVRLHWFNTETQQEEDAVLPEKIIHVAAGEYASKQPVNPEKTKPVNKAPEGYQPPASKTSSQPLLPWILVAVFAGAWALTTLFWFRYKNQTRSQRKIQKETLEEFKRACLHHQPRQAAEALMRWGRYQWPEDAPLNLNELSRRFKSQRLKQALQELSKHLYSPEPSPWQGEELWQLFSGHKNKRRTKKTTDNPLPPMNP